jgi:flavorubredoxin
MAKVLVAYYSGTGNTRKAAELVAQGAKDAGAEVEMMDTAKGIQVERLLQADAVAIGTPDYFSYPAGEVKVVFDRALAHKNALAEKPCVAFVSHGGGGRALEPLERLCKAVGLKPVADGLLVNGAPSGADADRCTELGRALAKAAG